MTLRVATVFSLYRIKALAFLMETQCFPRETETEYLGTVLFT
jgi:hypothetical protein